MSNRFLRWCWVLGLATLAVLHCNSRTQADTVLAGYDLFTSLSPGTTFAGVDFKGVPLGTFDFGGAIGTKNTGTADTIIQRLEDVTAPAGGSGSTRLEMVALQLVSVAPVDFGLGLGLYYITLQSARGGPASTGDMTINFADPTPGPPPPDQPVAGTFSSSINVAFDVRFGALDGPIALSDTLALSQQGALWSHYPAPGTLLIDGVNSNLNGQDHAFDFFPIGPFVETHPTGAMHTVVPATLGGGTIPEPSSIILGGIAMMFGVGLARRRRRASP